MSDITQQAILTLSKTFKKAADEVVDNATYARFYEGTIIRMTGDRTYIVSVGNSEPELKVYGNTMFKPGQHCYVVSPTNDKDFAHMFILGVGTGSADGSDPDHELLMQLVQEVRTKVDVGDIAQSTGQSATMPMSQKAVTDLVASISGGITGVLLGGKALTPDNQNRVSVPIATASSLGVVKSSSKTNEIQVDAQGTMSLSALDVMRLTQEANDKIILDGGDSKR